MLDAIEHFVSVLELGLESMNLKIATTTTDERCDDTLLLLLVVVSKVTNAMLGMLALKRLQLKTATSVP